MVSIGSAKALFDFDIVAGLIVAVIMDYVWANLSRMEGLKVLGTPIYSGFLYRDLATIISDAALAMVMKGRIRKIFIYALWFNIAMEVFQAVEGMGGYSTPLIPWVT